MLDDAPNGYDPTVAFVGSIMFCLLPFYFVGFWVNRKLRWKPFEVRTIVGGVLSGFAWFAFFLVWLGPVRGLFFALAALVGWGLGIWKAARRNELVIRTYYHVQRRKKAGASGAKPKPSGGEES